MKPLVIDIESYFDDRVSLSKLPLSEYVHRSEVLSVGVYELDAQAGVTDDALDYVDVWVWDQPDAPTLTDFLRSHGYHERPVVAHNAKFDLSMLWVHAGLFPKLSYCTMSMAQHRYGARDKIARYRNLAGGTNSLDSLANKFFGEGKSGGGAALEGMKGRRKIFTARDPQLADDYIHYMRMDVILCARLALKLAHSSVLAYEMAHWSAKVCAQSVLALDVDVLQRVIDREEQVRSDAVARAGMTGREAELRSNAKFAELLKASGIDVPMKKSPTTGHQIPALAQLDAEWAALKDNAPAFIQPLLAARAAERASQSQIRAAAYKRNVEALRYAGAANVAGRVPWSVDLVTGGAHTNRPTGGSAGGGSPLNLSRDSGLRDAVVPLDPRMMLYSFDFSAFELRIARFLAGDAESIQILDDGADLYVATIARILSLPASEVTSEQRRVGKQVDLSCQYGVGAATMFQRLKAAGLGGVVQDEQTCRRIVQGFRRSPAGSKLTRAWSVCDKWLINTAAWDKPCSFDGTPLNLPKGTDTSELGVIKWPSGRWLRYDNLQQTKEGELQYRRRGPDSEPTFIYGAKLFENIAQSLAAEIMDSVTVRLENGQLRVGLQIYDELHVVADPDLLDPPAFVALVENIVKDVTQKLWDSPPSFPIEAKFGPSYGEQQKVEL